MEQREVLTKNEERLMDYLWKQDKAMTVMELEQDLAEEGVKKATIFKAVQKLVEQGYLRVNGLERVGKAYARKFEPAITREEYAAIVLADKGIDTDSLINVAMAMIGNSSASKKSEDVNEKLIKELEEIIVKLRSRE